MIHFQCEHCRRPVRVADSCGGKRGRCPHCNEVVSIPAADDAIGALAAALEPGDLKEETAIGHIPPPPSVEQDGIEEDVVLPEQADHDLDDTVILPADDLPLEDSAPGQPFTGRRHWPVQSAPALKARRTFLVVAAIVVVLAAAVVGFVAIFLMGK